MAGLDDLGVRNLVVVHVDTLRADRLPLYGYARDTLPATQQMPWLVVDAYVAMDTWTLPSTTTMLTGAFPETHGVTHMTPAYEPNRGSTLPTLADHLKQHAYATFAASGNSAVQLTDFLVSGFDATTPHATRDSPSGLGALTLASMDWLDTVNGETPFFLFFQPMDVHAPSRPGDKLGTWATLDDLPFEIGGTAAEQNDAFRQAYAAATTEEERAAIRAAVSALYDETILNVDDGVQLLYAQLEERGLLDDTLIVLSADHGETLGDNLEDIGIGHGGTVRPELTHVPLAFHHPRLADQNVACLSMNADLAPTLVRALGLPPMDTADGEPLQGGCRGMARSSTFTNNTDANAVLEMLVTDGHSALRRRCRAGVEVRYDLDTDPQAQPPVARDDLTNVAALETEMESFYAALKANQGIEDCIVAR